ncbi:MAG TPA: SAM-dependent methyltransferase [Opitutus sp.]|nr:SAM-dependent methyltransferase [Opitutus sp.]
MRQAVETGALTKLTLGKYRGPDATLRNLFVRPVTLKTGAHLTFLWRHATRDVTKNHPPAAALAEIETLLGRDFLDAHLFSATETAQLETQPDGTARLRLKPATSSANSPAPAAHDRPKAHLIPTSAPWLRALGITNERGQPREGRADKYRQIQKFAELLSHLLDEAFPDDVSLPSSSTPTPLRVDDMGSGKGYLTFAVASLLGPRARVRGVEARAELVALCNQVARDHDLASHLSFVPGTIANAPLEPLDVLIALHACDTATDDALARGIAAGAKLLVVSPCCQKELRAQLHAPPVLADALQHGIFQERQAEFATDALRAQLLEWAGYRTRVFEFISTEHTAKNLMIAAVRVRPRGSASEPLAGRIRAFAQFYGIRSQALARQLEFAL